jgi:hypothetical protein
MILCTMPSLSTTIRLFQKGIILNVSMHELEQPSAPQSLAVMQPASNRRPQQQRSHIAIPWMGLEMPSLAKQ